MNKRILSITLVLAMLVGMFTIVPMTVSADTNSNVWDGTTATSFAGGDGTESNPYQISNGAELALMSKLITVDNNGAYNRAFYKLTADIVLNDFADVSTWYDNWYKEEGNYPDPTPFTPIGKWSNATSSFGGTFDGDGHTISGLYIWGGSSDNQGLFGAVQGGANICNFALVNSLIGNDCSGGESNIAALIGTTDRECDEDIYIENIYLDVYVYGGGKQVAGVIGNISNSGTNSAGEAYTPGVVNINAVTVSGQIWSENQWAAGFVASTRNVEFYITNCLVVNATINATKYCAGFVCKNTSGSVTQEISNSMVINTHVFGSNNRTWVYNSKSGNKIKVTNSFYMNAVDDANNALTAQTYATLSNVSEISDADRLYAFYNGDNAIAWEGWTTPSVSNNTYDMMRPSGIAEAYVFAVAVFSVERDKKYIYTYASQ